VNRVTAAAAFDGYIASQLKDQKISDKTMSGKKHSETIITNEQTIRRRAWIDSALESVRQRLGTFRAASDSETDSSQPRERRLYIASSNGTRRSAP